MTEERTEATSTVAATIYSILAFKGCSCAAEIFNAVRRIQHPYLGEDQFHEAVTELIKRGYVRDVNGLYSLIDLKCRPFRCRPRPEDLDFVEEEGYDGWRGWMVQDPHLGLMPIEEAIK